MTHPRGEEHYNWQGDSRLKADGYRLVYRREHPLADMKGYVREHRLVAQEALGRPLPRTAVLHHINGVRDDNRNSNLVICENNSYHRLLHGRIAAKAACGHAYWVMCYHCKEWGPEESMYVHPRRIYKYHQSCRNVWQNARYHARRAAMKQKDEV